MNCANTSKIGIALRALDSLICFLLDCYPSAASLSSSRSPNSSRSSKSLINFIIPVVTYPGCRWEVALTMGPADYSRALFSFLELRACKM